jgi:hypothetical protein
MCDADAKADAFVLWQIRVPALHPALHGDGATDGIDDRGELDQQPSPVVLQMRPRCWSMSGSINSRRWALRAARVFSSSAPISRE